MLGSTQRILLQWKRFGIDDKIAAGQYCMLKGIVEDVHTAETKVVSYDDARNNLPQFKRET